MLISSGKTCRTLDKASGTALSGGQWLKPWNGQGTVLAGAGDYRRARLIGPLRAGLAHRFITLALMDSVKPGHLSVAWNVAPLPKVCEEGMCKSNSRFTLVDLKKRFSM